MEVFAKQSKVWTSWLARKLIRVDLVRASESSIVYCVARVLLSHKALRDYPIVIIRRKLLNVIPKQVASFGDKKQHSTFNHLLNSEMGSHWRKGEICGVDNCRSRLYTVDENDGYHYCENGHRRGVSHLTSEVKSENCSSIYLIAEVEYACYWRR